jgi:alpha-methylacyl-CoA racemase
MYAGLLASGLADERRAAGLLDGGAPFYAVYETADGRHVSVGALEPQFYAVLVERLGLEDPPDRDDPTQWPRLRDLLTRTFLTRTQAAWTALFDGTDACVAPVLTLTEAARHPQLHARGTYVDHAGVLQPAPAPRFSRTAATLTTGPSVPGGQTREALGAWGIDDVDALLASGAAVQT